VENIMENMPGTRTGPQLYVLSEQGYEELRNIESTLLLMAQVTHSEDDDKNGNAMLTISRIELSNYFLEVSTQIAFALNRLSTENWMEDAQRTRQ
jgi:hypothetical protein